MPDPREPLLRRIARVGDPNDSETPHALATLEEFFEGNDDLGSIGFNFYPEQPSPAEFYDLFKRIREKPMVADVRVQVTVHDDVEAWPVTDTVWLITSATAREVSTWLGERFAADAFFEGFLADHAYEPVTVPDGMRAVGVWWD